MNKSEIMALVNVYASAVADQREGFFGSGPAVSKARAAIEAALPDVPTVPESVISGALFDFAGYLTTLDGEGGYDLRLYENNETYRDNYIQRNGEKYSSWVVPLYAAPQAQPMSDEQHVLVPLADLEAAAESLGSFCSDHGWSDADMQNMDNLLACIAQHKAKHKIGG
jgi:hypothetical protein